MDIRLYRPDEFEMIRGWWIASGETAPLETMLPETTYVLSVNGTPGFCISLICTNVSEYAWLENFIANPSLTFTKNDRHKYSQAIVSHAEAQAREHGYRRLICMSEKPALARRYSSLGYVGTLKGVSILMKEIVCPQQQ